MAYMYEKQKKYEDAEKNYLIAIEKTDKTAYFYYIDMLYDLQRFADAIPYAIEAMDKKSFKPNSLRKHKFLLSIYYSFYSIENKNQAVRQILIEFEKIKNVFYFKRKLDTSQTGSCVLCGDDDVKLIPFECMHYQCAECFIKFNKCHYDCDQLQ